MADALQNAPLKEEEVLTDGERILKTNFPNQYQLEKLFGQFDTEKKYMFELVNKNPEREHPVIDMISKRPAPHQEFKPYQNIILTSQIIWNGGRVVIRYYDGCESIFVSEQPKDKDAIDQYISQTKKRFFEKGKFGCYGDEKNLLLFLNACSWNADSQFKTKTSNQVFVSVNPDKKAQAESNRLDLAEDALKLAREASETKMKVHGDYLGIPMVDYDSGNERTEKQIRTDYRKEALRDPKRFIDTFGDSKLEIRYYIDQALQKGLISNKSNPNKATWGKNNSVICDISGLRSNEAISNKLFEFSQTEEGEEFVIMLKGLFE